MTNTAYLVALVVGPLAHIDATTPAYGSDDSVVVRCFAPVGRTSSVQFALDEAVACLASLQNTLKSRYPLPKLDLVPLDSFAAGAMENYGLVTFRTSLLLTNDNTASTVKERVATVIAHELAHQWMGNSTTMLWWNDLFLNEGFATLMEYHVIHDIHPEWAVWDHFDANVMHGATELDALRTTHSIRVTVDTQADIEQIFDHISYNKGGTVLRMLAAFLGWEPFLDALHTYVEKYKFDVATIEQLMKVLDDATGHDVTGIMTPWLTQEGYPVVTVQQEGNELHMAQERFIAGGGSGAGVWPLPLVIAFYNKDGTRHSEQRLVMRGKTESITVPEDLIAFVNSGHTTLCRVHYTAGLVAHLGPVVSQLTSSEFCGVLDDAHALAEAGRAPVVDLLDLVAAPRPGPPVYGELIGISQKLATIGHLLSFEREHDEDIRDRFKKLKLSVVESTFKDLLARAPIAPEQHNDCQIFALVASMFATSTSDAAFIAQLHAAFDTVVASIGTDTPASIAGLDLVPNDIANFKNAVLFGAASTASHAASTHTPQAMFDALITAGQRDTGSDGVLCLRAACMITDPAVAVQVCPTIWDVARFPVSAWVYVSRALPFTLSGRHVFLRYLVQDWDTLAAKLSSGMNMFGYIVEDALACFSQKDEVEATINTIATQTMPANCKRPHEQAVETARVRAAWWSRDAAKACEWLREKM